MPKVHPMACVDPTAELGEDVEVGPFSVIEAGVVLGARCRVDNHATICSGTTMGDDNYVGMGSILGGDPQDAKWKGESTFLTIGNGNTFREYVTVHRATGEGQATVVGDRNFIMAYCHLGHNVTLCNDITIANNVGISGHVTVEDLVNIGGMVGIHQWARVGKVSMVGGMTKVVRDIPPYMISAGESQEVHDINAIGLRRIGVSPAERLALHRACKLLYRSQLGLSHAMKIVEREIVPMTEHVKYLLTFERHRGDGRNGRGDQPGGLRRANPDETPKVD